MTAQLTPEASKFIAELTKQLSQKSDPELDSEVPTSHVLREWIGYLHHNKLTGGCDHFLDGIRSLLMEGLICVASGVKRSSILSMRGQIDLSLSWLYYKDHSVEWDKVERENEGYKLKSEVFKYLEFYIPHFSKRMNGLTSNCARETVEPYKVLSSHIHSMGLNVIPSISSYADILDGSSRQQLYQLQADVCEYISDLFMSYFASDWAALPNGIVHYYKTRLGQQDFAKVIGS